MDGGQLVGSVRLLAFDILGATRKQDARFRRARPWGYREASPDYPIYLRHAEIARVTLEASLVWQNFFKKAIDQIDQIT